MSAYARFLDALTEHGFKYKGNRQGGRVRAQCPAHNGDDLNLAVAIGDQGVLLKCHSYDCPAEDIAHAVGLTLDDLFDSNGRAVYHYPEGHDVIRRRTRDGKEIFQRNAPKVTELYRHPDSVAIEDAEEVVVVEGEKSVDAALRLGFPCVTTWPGGAGQVDKVDLTPLHGKTVHLIADNDEPGRAAMGHLAMMLAGVATVKSITTAPGEHQGIDDIWLDGGDHGDLVPFDPSNYIKPPVDDDGREMVIDFFEGKASSRTTWLWDGIVPLGAASVWAGMGGVSKSVFSLWFASRVTRGLVKGEFLDEPNTVLLVSHEDDPLRVVLPRLQVHQADMSRVATCGVKFKEVNGVMMPTFPEDIPRLERAIVKSGAKLVIIDPVLSTMEGDKNMNDARHVREVIDPLNQLAQRLNVAIVCIAHVNKGSTSARTAVSGSGAWVDATRATVIFAMEEVDPDEDYQQVVMQGKKMNYGKTDQAYSYRVHGVDHLHDDGSVQSVPKIQFLGLSTRTVDDVMVASEDRRGSWLVSAIKEYIDSVQGVTTTSQVLVEFKDQNPATVRQALSRLVKSGKVHSPGRAMYQSIKYAPQGP